MVKKIFPCLMAGLLSASFFSGCFGGDTRADANDTREPDAAPGAKLELEGVPCSTFPCGDKTAKIYNLKGPWGDRDFIYLGNEFVFAGGKIYFYGDSYDGRGGTVRGLYEHELEGGEITSKTCVAEGADVLSDRRTLSTSMGKVLFHTEKGKLGIYNGRKESRSGGKWKDEYDNMIGFADSSDLLLVRAPDTICTARREGTDIKDLKVIVQNAGYDALCPVYADADAMFLSTPADLVAFDQNGKLLTRYEGLRKEHCTWAVTKHYVVQSSRDGDLRIYERTTGKKIHDANILDIMEREPVCLYSLDDDKILVRTYGPQYAVWDLGY